MPGHFKIEEELSPEELEELRKFVRDANGTRTTDEVFEWVQAHGFTGGRTAVANWLQKLREELTRERFGRSGELAAAIKGAVAGGQFSDVADAAVMQLTQVVFEQAVKLECDGEIDAKQVAYMTKSLRDLTATKGEVDELKKKQVQAVKAAEAAASKGATGVDVVATIKQALGITA